MRLISIIAGLAFVTTAASAGAVTVFSDDFNAAGYVGAPLGGVDTSDRFGPTTYGLINNFNGWSFASSSTFIATNGFGDGAVLLNENAPGGSASRTLTGLIIGRLYTVSVLLSGDNRLGLAYTLEAAIDGLNLSSTPGTVLASGTNPGTPVTFNFTATGTSALLAFSQTAAGEGSPVIDNVSVTTIPEPATWGLLVGGFAMVGTAARRRRKVVAA